MLWRPLRPCKQTALNASVAKLSKTFLTLWKASHKVMTTRRAETIDITTLHGRMRLNLWPRVSEAYIGTVSFPPGRRRADKQQLDEPEHSYIKFDRLGPF